jgi:acyl carrier protein
MNTELLQNIEKVIRDVVNNQTLSVKAESTLISDLGLESIDLLDISSELENTIGKEIDFKSVAQFSTQKSGKALDMKSLSVQDLMDYIQAH